MNDETKQAIGDAVDKTVEAAEETVQRPAVKKLARLGFYTKGILFIVIGTLAVMLVAGLGGKIADSRGVLAAVASEKFGSILLIIFVVGAAGHGLWNILRGAADVDDLGTGLKGIVVRIVSIGIGFFYLGLGAAAVEILLAARASDASSQVEETFIAVLLAVPVFGAILLFVIGLGVMGAGVNECYSGISGRFRDNYRLWEISGPHRTFISVLGVLSFTARALLMVIMGYFFIRAAFYGNPDSGIGLDASLLSILNTTYGRILVGLTAVGLIGHGILAFYEARYRRIC